MRTRPAFVLTCLALGACSSGPSLDELNAVYPSVDPTADQTPASAPFAPGQRRDVGGAATTFMPGVGNEFVENVVMPGDLDGDGIDDLVLSGWEGNAPTIVPCDNGCPGFSQAVVHVVYGSSTLGTSPTMHADATITSWHVNSLRYSVNAAGDVDGDGHPDLLVSVGTTGCEQGDVYLVRGGTRLSGASDVRDVGSLLRETGGCLKYGDGAGVGDVDGDGIDDFTIAAPGNGRVYLYYGAKGAPPARRSEADADASFHAKDGAIGRAIAAGDVDGDGRGDFVLGIDASDGTHALWIVRGGATRFNGDVEVDAIGTRVDAVRLAPLGDLDGDGKGELAAIVASGRKDAYVIAGRASWPASLDVTTAGTWVQRDADIVSFATATAARAGDVDGDGHPDFLYGDPSYAPEGAPRGAIYLFRGPTSLTAGGLPPSASTAFLGQDWFAVMGGAHRGYDELGLSIGAGSDINGDGLDDFVLVARIAPDGGRAYVWLGRRGS